MEIISTQKYAHTSPRKLRLVVDMVRKMHPVQAMTVLHFTPKSAAGDLKKAISTAVANARQGGLNFDTVHFKSIEVNEGPVMKRFRPASKGRALPYKRRMSHVKIVLSDDLKQTFSKKEVVKSEELKAIVDNKEVRTSRADALKAEEKKGESKTKRAKTNKK